MMTARERAIDIMWKAVGKGFTKAVFRHMVDDDGAAGQELRKLVDAIEAGIEEDRRVMQKAQAPS